MPHPPAEPHIETFRDVTHTVNGVRLHVVEAGPPGGELVVLLHGFPEFWWSWRRQIQAFSDAGYRVLAPDMRGYGQSDKPRRVKSYALHELARDVAELIAAAGRERAVVVGHDWGAMVAWEVAMRHPERVLKLGILNVPHPRRMLTGLLTLRQLKKSWYIFFFQLPFLPEHILEKNDFEGLRRMFTSEGFTEDEVDSYVDAFRYEGALHSALGYYRAAFRRTFTLRLGKPEVIRVPVLVIWGRQDRVLGVELAEPPKELVPNARVEYLDASHWVQHDQPARVSELLLAFFRER